MSRDALVVFGWAGFNALLTLVLVIYSWRDPFPLAVYSGAVVVLGTFGVVVLLSGRQRMPSGPYLTATRSASAGFLGFALTLIGLGFFYGLWLMLFALYPLVLAAVLVRRERVPDSVLRRRPP